MALSTHFQRNLPFAFNRKEVKDHGEGGRIVGAPIQGNVAIIDDVITAGTAFHEAKEIIEAEGGTVSAVVVALDRQERGQAELSAIDEIKQRYNIDVISIAKLADIVEWLSSNEHHQQALQAIKNYQQLYRSISK